MAQARQERFFLGAEQRRRRLVEARETTRASCGTSDEPPDWAVQLDNEDVLPLAWLLRTVDSEDEEEEGEVEDEVTFAHRSNTGK